MKRRYRLTDKERFRQVRQTGISYTHPLLVLCVLPNDQPFSRSGFTVSRRLGKAVQRNRIRRRMHEAVRLIWGHVVPGWDMVWIARPAIKAASFLDIQAACLQLLRRAHVWQAAATTGDGERMLDNIGSNQVSSAGATPVESFPADGTGGAK